LAAVSGPQPGIAISDGASASTPRSDHDVEVVDLGGELTQPGDDAAGN
jgi:hypothetical protein